MIDLNDYLDDVRREVPGVRKVLMLKALQNAATDFAHQTHIWRREIPEMEVCNVFRAVVLVPDIIGCCNDADVNALALDTILKDDMFLCDEKPIHQPVPSEAQIELLSGCVPASIRFRVAEQLIEFKGRGYIEGLEVVLRPTANMVGDEFERWDRAIIEGTLWKLLSMSGVSWSDPAMAQQKRLLYERLVDQAAHLAMRDHTTRPLTLTTRPMRGWHRRSWVR